MSTVTWAERVYFAAVGLLAAVVGLPTYFAPARAKSVLPFDVPPLHARLIGAMYLSGLTIMVGSLLARRWAEVRLAPAITAIWTGGLLLVTLLHLEAFDFSKIQTQIWFGAYLAYPLIGIWILISRRGQDGASAAHSAGKPLARRYLTVQGVALAAVGLALLFAPGPMAAVWPWPVTPLLAQVYSAPLLAYGSGSLLLARQPGWSQMRVVLTGIAMFPLAALIGSLLHLNLFASGDPAAWIWFAALAALTVGNAVTMVSLVRDR